LSASRFRARADESTEPSRHDQVIPVVIRASGGGIMISRKDIVATVLTGIVVLTYTASIQAWSVPLVGHSHRWAAAAILVLGMLTCGQGTARSGSGAILLGVLGVATLGVAITAIVTGSTLALALLTVATVLLWAASTTRHLFGHGGTPVAT
jgi:hypothetical protein